MHYFKKVKPTKSSILKNIHTRDKIIQIDAKKSGLQYDPEISKLLKRRCISEKHGVASPANHSKYASTSNQPLNINLGRLTVTESMPSLFNDAIKEQFSSEDERELTARKANNKIMSSLDSLMKDNRFKIKEKEMPIFRISKKKLTRSLYDRITTNEFTGPTKKDAMISETNEELPYRASKRGRPTRSLRFADGYH